MSKRIVLGVLAVLLVVCQLGFAGAAQAGDKETAKPAEGKGQAMFFGDSLTMAGGSCTIFCDDGSIWWEDYVDSAYDCACACAGVCGHDCWGWAVDGSDWGFCPAF